MRLQWNHPPGWPEPPAGWQPAPGWQPDPSWPRPEDSWQFWVWVPEAQAGRKKRLVLGIGVGLTVLAIVLAFAVVLITRVASTTRDAKLAARLYVSALQTRDFAGAQAMLCADDQNDPTGFIRHWRATVASGHAITAFSLHNVQVRTINGHQSGQVDVELTYADSTRETAALALVQTSGRWRPCPAS